MDSPMEHESGHEWELSKENVQPLRQGRKFSNLTAALQPHSTDHLTKLREERQVFETEIRMYQGEDPLGIWDRYISWTEQNFPKGGKESNLQAILEHCVSLYKDEEKYKNDPRYLNVWIKFANICNDPLEIYNFLYSQGIGTKTASLYEAWAWQVEQVGNIKKADLLYNKGIENGAQPIERLRQTQSEFQARVIRQTAVDMADGMAVGVQMDTAESGGQRAALGELKGRGKHSTVSVNRATNRTGTTRGPTLGSIQPAQNRSNQGFKVFTDENAVPGTLPSQTGEWASAPSRDMNRENQQKPGVWNKAKVKQRSVPNVKLSEVGMLVQREFSVHEDEDLEQPLTTPRKFIPEVNQILSAKKPEKNSDPFYHVMHDVKDPKFAPQYCKHKIYGGTQEFSFEELRAAKWRERKAKEEEEKRLQAERAEIEKQKADLKRKQDELDRMNMQWMAERENEMKENMERERKLMQEQMMVALQAQQQQVQKLPSSDLQAQPPRPQAQPARPLVQPPRIQAQQPRPQAQPPIAQTQPSGRTSTRSLNFTNNSLSEPACNSDTLQSRAACLNQSKQRTGNKSITPSNVSFGNTSSRTPSFFSNSLPSVGNTSSGGGRRSNPTPDSSILGSQNSMNRSSAKSTPRGIAAPSPTVNTRLAIQNVLGMFDHTLDIEKNFGFRQMQRETDELEAEYFAPLAQDDSEGGLLGMNAAPFKIFEEDEVSQESKKPSSTTGEEDQENKENTPPRGYQQCPRRQGVSSILQPALDVASGSRDTEDKENRVSPVMDFHQDVDMEDEVISAPKTTPVNIWEDEHMDAVESEVNFDPSDMTFAPNYASTRNFTEAALLASTPFNPQGNMAPLPEPPVSTIKNVCPVSIPTSQASLSEYKVDSESCEMSTAETLKSRRSSMYTGKQDGAHDLSPIMERSDEDAKSAGSSLGSTHTTTTSDAPTFNSTHHSTQHQTYPILGRSVALPPITELRESRLSSSTSTDKSVNSGKSSSPSEELGDMSCHEIDITNYVMPDPEDKSEHLMNMSIAIDPRDPFDEGLVKRLMSNLEKPLITFANYHEFNEPLPEIVPMNAVKLGEEMYDVQSLLGEGGFAKVFQAEKISTSSMDTDEQDTKVIKVQKPGCPLELYSVNVLHQRLTELDSRDVRPSIMSIENGYFFTDGSCLVNEMHNKGTLLTLVNAAKRTEKKALEEPLVMYLTIELLLIVEQLHKCQIIHGDFKPDNLLIRQFPTNVPDMASFLQGSTKCLKLIDFGRCIDMTLFPAGTTFLSKVNTSGFQCIEMKTDRPWTYQTDIFGLLGTVHVMLFGSYMNVYLEDGRWKTNTSVKRYMKACSVWKKMFDELLNIPSCTELPQLNTYREELEKLFLRVKIKDFNHYLSQLQSEF